ncbi:MAG: hypothetical protein OXC93_05990, partial [Rhodospirillaceae bacterium]|nr:hypothetical protein [Rhodospirillaceae bacterium]
RHVRPTLGQVDLGFAGRRLGGDPMHGAIADLSVGDPLDVRVGEDGRWKLLDRNARTVGRLARSFNPPSGMRCRSVTVFAILEWSRDASDPNWLETVKCDAWEVVVPELVFMPDR